MNWSQMFFQNWEGIVRTLIVGVLAYAALVLFLRTSGKRTLAKLNAFDCVVALLILLQYLVTFASVRSQRFARMLRSEPTLLARNGAFCAIAMKHQRVTEGEAMSAIRSAGGSDVSSVDYVILESDGTLSVGLRR